MKVFGQEPRFHPRTGKPMPSVKIQTGWACDYCGVYHANDEESQKVVSYRIVETGEAEPQFDGMKVEGFPRIDLYALFSDHPEFRYCQDWDGRRFCEQEMLLAWHKAKKNGAKARTLFEIMYEARLAMIGDALKSGRQTMESFDLKKR